MSAMELHPIVGIGEITNGTNLAAVIAEATGPSAAVHLHDGEGGVQG